VSPRRVGADEAKRRFWRQFERRWGARAGVRPIAVFDPRPDRLLPTLKLVELGKEGAHAGLCKPIKERPLEDYPAELDSQMEFKEPQFILRNIPRVEKIVDDWLEFDHSRVMVRDWHGLVEAVHRQRYAAPELLGELNVARVAAYREGIRQLFFRADWSRHFCAELNRKLDGPVWKYDPDKPTEELPPGATRLREV